jgi:hypothetical protein
MASNVAAEQTPGPPLHRGVWVRVQITGQRPPMPQKR